MQIAQDPLLKSIFPTVRNIVGTAGIAFAGYVLGSAVPNMRRYLRIVRM
jgi:hypothetical protein